MNMIFFIVARAMHQYMDYIRQNDIGLKSMLTPMAQVCIRETLI